MATLVPTARRPLLPRALEPRTWNLGLAFLLFFFPPVQVQHFPPVSQKSLGTFFPASLLSSTTPTFPGSPRTDKHTVREEDSNRSCDMAAIATSSPLASLNPTTTDHDWRFPRRPTTSDNDDADSGAGAMRTEQSEDTAATASAATAAPAVSKNSPSMSTSSANKTRADAAGTCSKRTGAGLGDTVKQLRFDLSNTFSAAQSRLSKVRDLPDFCDGLAGMSPSPDELAKEDPLAIQVWRLYAKTKQTLPNQERMENLTWRMMHANFRKQSQAGDDDEANRYAYLTGRLYCKRTEKPIPRLLSPSMSCRQLLTRHSVSRKIKTRRFSTERPQWHRPAAQVFRAEHIHVGAHEPRRLHCR